MKHRVIEMIRFSVLLNIIIGTILITSAIKIILDGDNLYGIGVIILGSVVILSSIQSAHEEPQKKLSDYTKRR